MKALFSTDGLNPSQSFRRWRETLVGRGVPLERARLDDGPFAAKLEAARVGPLLLTRVSHGAMRSEATRGLIQRNGKDGTVVVQRAKAHVESHLGDPTLDAPQLPAAVGVSLRRLQELFHARGQHISDWIWQHRLEVAAERLVDPGSAHLPIGTLAFGCGFASQARFSRRFKERYGSTPREYRHAAFESIP